MKSISNQLLYAICKLEDDVEKKIALKNFDLTLCIDDIVNGRIMPATDGNVITGKFATNNLQFIFYGPLTYLSCLRFLMACCCSGLVVMSTTMLAGMNAFAGMHLETMVRLVPYDPSFHDESVLWSESKDLGDGFHCIRKVNDISLNFDAFHGDKDHGGVRDGTVVVLYEWFKKSMNQCWKILFYANS